jgi:GTP-binding protein EngB required for normal cell division
MTSAMNRDKTADWVRSIRTLAKQTGVESAVKEYLENQTAENTDAVHIAVLGALNTGKSNLVNTLLERRLLPVSPLASGLSFLIRPADATEKEHFVAGGAIQSLDGLASVSGADPGTARVQVFVDNPWLAARQLWLAEPEALDAPDHELNSAIQRAVRGVDFVVLTIDSLMPMRRSETVVLAECARRGLPLIVALMKTDLLSSEERQSMGEYLNKQIQDWAPGITLVEIGLAPGCATGVEQLKEEIDEILATSDFTSVRFHQDVEEFLCAVGLISTAAAAAIDIQNKTKEERAADGRRRKLAADEQGALWSGIEGQLQLRRHELDDQIRKGLDGKNLAITDVLLHDLESRTDIKAWWERELPYRLSRELRAAAESLSGMANRRIAADIQWLQSELTRCFRLPPAAIQLPANIGLEGGDFPHKDISLRDTNKMRIVARVGQAAAVIMAGRLLLTAGLSGATMGLSILAGLAAEQLTMFTASKDRQKARAQLSGLIEKASIEYAVDVSRKLKAGYDEILTALREQQARWERAQGTALRAIEASVSSSQIDWTQVTEQASALERELRAAISSRVSAGSASA